MSRSLFLSSTSIAVVALLPVVAGGCGDDSCGPGGAPSSGLIAGDVDNKLTFGNLASGANHDCPTEPTVEPLTISGSQTDGTGLVTLCISRPDRLMAGAQLGTDVHVIDLNGTFNMCDYVFESTRPISGTVTGTGVCNNGLDPAGYALTFDAHISLRRTCATTTDTIAVNFYGTVAVTAK